MSKPRHKGDTKTFEELNFAEQSKSITAQINVLQRSFKRHINDASGSTDIRKKCIGQVIRLLDRLVKE